MEDNTLNETRIDEIKHSIDSILEDSISEESLAHHGIIGQKWGIRRFQNKDGSLTPRGKKRYEKEMDKLKKEESVLKNKERTKKMFDKLDAKKASIENRKRALSPEANKVQEKNTTEIYKGQDFIGKKNVRSMTDEELKRGVERGRLESEYLRYYPEKVSSGKKFANSIKTGAFAAAKGATEDALKAFLSKGLKKVLGVDNVSNNDIGKAVKPLDDATKKTRETIKEAVKKETAKKAEQDSRPDDWEMTVIDTRSKQNSDTGRKYTNDVIINTTSREVTPQAQLGRSYVAGLLPAPKEKD